MTLNELEERLKEFNAFTLSDAEYYAKKELFLRSIGRFEPGWSNVTIYHHGRAAVTHGGYSVEEVLAKATLVFG